jgi:hypothetical protein
MQTFAEYVYKRNFETKQFDEVNLKQLLAGLGIAAAGNMGTQAADIHEPNKIPTVGELNKLAKIEAGEKGKPSYAGVVDRNKELHRYIPSDGGKPIQTGYYPHDTARNLKNLQKKDPTWYFDTKDNLLKNDYGELADPFTGKIIEDLSKYPHVKLHPAVLKKSDKEERK